MPIESASYVSQLDANNPVGSDDRSTLDNQDRLVKQVLINTFKDLRGPVSASAGEMNFLVGVTANLQTQLNDTNSLLRSSSAVLQTSINTLSATLNTRITDDIRSTSAAIQTVINTLSGTLTTNLSADIRSTSAAIQTVINTKLTTTNQAMAFIEVKTAASSATIDFTTGIDATYDVYQIELCGVVPATNLVELRIRVSTDGGSTFIATANYNYDSYEANVSVGATAQSEILITGHNVSNTAVNGGVNMTVKLRIPSSTSQRKSIEWYGSSHNDSSLAEVRGVGHCDAAAVATGNIDAIRFLFDAGNIASGTFTLYGLRKV